MPRQEMHHDKVAVQSPDLVEMLPLLNVAYRRLTQRTVEG